MERPLKKIKDYILVGILKKKPVSETVNYTYVAVKENKKMVRLVLLLSNYFQWDWKLQRKILVVKIKIKKTLKIKRREKRRIIY